MKEPYVSNRGEMLSVISSGFCVGYMCYEDLF